MLRNTGRVTIELSNRCDMAYVHKKCPLHEKVNPVFLSLNIAKRIIRWLGTEKFEGFITFHNYNEALQDPRLYYLLDYARKKCKKGRVFILTNGHWLNQLVLNELGAFGVKKVYVSAYSDRDYQRLNRLKSSELKYRVRRIDELDDRKIGYETTEDLKKAPCYAPLGEVVIRCTGDVVLCCRDWNNQHVFGSVMKESLKEILSKKSVLGTYKKLSNGDRYFDLCGGCRMKGRYKNP